MTTVSLTAKITIPEWLVVLRRRAGYSQVKAADLSGVNHRHLMKLETGEMDCRVDDIVALATLYGVSPATFLAVDATAPGSPQT